MEHKLNSVVDDHFREEKNRQKKYKIPKQSESVFGLSAFCHVLKSFPGARALHCCSGIQKWPREQTSSLAEKVSMKRDEEWLEVAMGRKKDRR